MNLIDTHCHLYSEEFTTDIRDVMKRAMDNGVTKFYLPAIDSHAIQDMLSLEQEYPGICISMMGLHPCYVKENYREELRSVEEWLQKKAINSHYAQLGIIIENNDKLGGYIIYNNVY